MYRQSKEIPDVTGAARDDGIELTLQIADDRLESTPDHPRLLERNLTDRARQERDPTLSRLNQRHPQSWRNDFQRNARDPGSRAGVQNVAHARRQDPEEQQAVKEDPVDDPTRVYRPEQPVRGLPFNQ